jgi:NhaP-type Na+/H+ or K+/H+ antiporter
MTHRAESGPQRFGWGLLRFLVNLGVIILLGCLLGALLGVMLLAVIVVR